MMAKLGITRARVFDYIVAFKTEHDGISPTIREIGDAVGIPLGSVNHHLQTLEERGRIRRYTLNGRQTKRNIMIVGEHK